MFVGEAPGLTENKTGIPFTGQTGRENNEHYLPLAGLRREDCFYTNAIRCLPISSKGKLHLDRNTDRALLESCASTFLYKDIEQLQPSLIIAMGAFSCHALDPDITLDLHHGIPLQTKLGTVFPMWHPAGGIHEPKKMLQIRTDWVRLKQYLRGTLPVPVDRFPHPDYREATESDVDNISIHDPMAGDTEYSKSKGPYFLTWSQQPGWARLIKADRVDLLARLQKKLNKFKAPIYFHNWLYDWTITEEMGLQFPPTLMKDTMLMAYWLGNLPQGLKVLAYRLLGMEMQDFEDLVKPYSAKVVLDYYKKAAEQEWIRPDEQLVIDDKTGRHKLYRPQSMKTKLKRFFTDVRNNPDKDVFGMWDKNWVDHQEELEAKCGPYPGVDIAHVPYEEAAYYAMRDSDADIRLVPILLKMKELAMSGLLQEKWV